MEASLWCWLRARRESVSRHERFGRCSACLQHSSRCFSALTQSPSAPILLPCICTPASASGASLRVGDLNSLSLSTLVHDTELHDYEYLPAMLEITSPEQYCPRQASNDMLNTAFTTRHALYLNHPSQEAW